MNKSLCIAVMLSASLQSMAGEATPGQSRYLVSQPGLEVSARRGAAEGTYEISAVLSDTDTGKAIASPKLTVRAGTWASASIGGRTGAQPSASFSATVDPSGNIAAFLAHTQKTGASRKTYSGTAMVAP